MLALACRSWYQKSTEPVVQEVVKTLTAVDLSWVCDDQERPYVDSSKEAKMTETAKWSSLISEIRKFVERWLFEESPEPMGAILRLEQSAVTGVCLKDSRTRLPPSS